MAEAKRRLGADFGDCAAAQQQREAAAAQKPQRRGFSFTKPKSGGVLHAAARVPQEPPPPQRLPQRTRQPQLHQSVAPAPEPPPPPQRPAKRQRTEPLHSVVAPAPAPAPAPAAVKRRHFKPPRLVSNVQAAAQAAPQRGGPGELVLPTALPRRRPRVPLLAYAARNSRAALRRPQFCPPLAPTRGPDPHRFKLTSVPAPLTRLLAEAGVRPSATGLCAADFRRLLLHVGAAAGVVTDEWAANALRWVVFKLSAMDVLMTCAGGCRAFLAPEHALAQLVHRYNTEHVQGRRSALRRLYEGDDTTAGKLLALKVASTSPAAGDVELTDGWYSIPGVLDERLKERLQQGCIAAGQVLLTYAPAMAAGAGAVPPLDAMRCPGSRALRLSANSTRPARQPEHGGPTHLGFVRTSSRKPCVPLVPIATCDPAGGLIPGIEVVVQRVYPAVHAERVGGQEDGRWVTRDGCAEDHARDDWERRRAAAVEDARARVAQQFADEQTDGGREFEARLRAELESVEKMDRHVSSSVDVLVSDTKAVGGACHRALVRVYSQHLPLLESVSEGDVVVLYHVEPSKWQPQGSRQHGPAPPLSLRCTRGFFVRRSPQRSDAFVPRKAPTLRSISRLVARGEDFDFVGVVVQSPARADYAAAGREKGDALSLSAMYVCDSALNTVLRVCAASGSSKQIRLAAAEQTTITISNLRYGGSQTMPSSMPGLQPLVIHHALADEHVRVCSAERGPPQHLKAAYEMLSGASESAAALAPRMRDVISGVSGQSAQRQTPPPERVRQPGGRSRETVHGAPAHAPQQVAASAPPPPPPPPAPLPAHQSCLPAAVEAVQHVYGALQLPYTFTAAAPNLPHPGVIRVVAGAVPMPISGRMAQAAGPPALCMYCTLDDGWSAPKQVVLKEPQLQALLLSPASPTAQRLIEVVSPGIFPGTVPPLAAMRRHTLDRIYPLHPQQNLDASVHWRRFCHAVSHGHVLEPQEEAQFLSNGAPPIGGVCMFDAADWTRLWQTVAMAVHSLSKMTLVCQSVSQTPRASHIHSPTGAEGWAVRRLVCLGAHDVGNLMSH
eukprot:TRINITY_DN3905_c2_g1_i2.p1 TRINITY_DN3905_c2_g1~~TRINITY_DN3905_c2_g1_i2.p1  ORF type:complete len:1102 (+),score=400.90 TRINITY_DN3905_c2_g1_i2:117-3308(+)